MTTGVRFDLCVPTQIVYGRGRLEELGKHAGRFGSHCLLVTGRAMMSRTGVTDRAISALRRFDLEVTVFPGVVPNPCSEQVDESIELLHRNGCDVVVGLGGGSALDVAKAAAVIHSHGSAREWIGVTVPHSARSLPIVAVPTTAGSGSEVTKGALIVDTTRQLKAGIRGEDLFPRVAIVDPELTDTLPRHISVETGFDALAHAIEGYVARQASPITANWSEQAVSLIYTHLLAIAAGDKEPGHRDALCLAALLGGLVVATASTCLPHRLQQAMGSLPMVRVSHGRGLAALYPAWLRHAEPYVARRFGRLAELLDGRDLPTAIDGLLDRLGLRSGLRDWGLRSEDLSTLIAKVTGNVDNDPIGKIDEELMLAVLRDAL